MSNRINYKERFDAFSKEIFEMKTENSAEMKIKQRIYNTAFWDGMQTGYVSNALKEGSDGSGGYLVPDEFDKRIIKALEEENILRKLGKVIKTERNLRYPRLTNTVDADWCDESGFCRVGDCEFDELVFDAHKLGVLTKLTNELIEDSPHDVECLVRDMFVVKMKRKEEEAFFNGNGIHKPLGIIHQAQVGATSENKGAITFDDVIDLYYSLKVPYRKNAVWVMSEEACEELKKVKTDNGFYLWDKVTGKPDFLLGKPVYTTTQLGVVESGSKPILFGDFSYFWIAERGKRNIMRLSEKYANQGMIGYLTFQRVDAKLVIPEAVKSLEIK